MSVARVASEEEASEDLKMIQAMAARFKQAGWKLQMLVADPPVMVLTVHGFEQLRIPARPGWQAQVAIRLSLKPDGELTGDVLQELWSITEVLS